MTLALIRNEKDTGRLQRIYLKNISYSVENLPSEPALLAELLDLCHDEASVESFSVAIRKDIGLAAKFLQITNSPIYRQTDKQTDIRTILNNLGTTNSKNIVETSAIQQFFTNPTQNFNNHIRLIWLRGLGCANLAGEIAKRIGYEKPEEAFLAGLFHQVGMLLLLLNREESYLPILDRYYSETEKFLSLEQEQLQVDHCELGSALIESWDLDSFIADAIRFQYAPVNELLSAPTLLKILAAASPLSSKNVARNNLNNLKRAELLLGIAESPIRDCLTLAVEKSQAMISSLGFNSQFYMVENEEETLNTPQDDNSRKELAEKVENIALSNAIGKSKNIELIEFTKEIRINFTTLFNQNQLFFFKVNDDQTTLSAINDLEINQLDEINFEIGDKNSLLTRAFEKRSGIISLNEKCSIADKQVIRLLKTEEAYFIPLYFEKTGIGVLAIGITELEWSTLQNKVPLLKLLSQEIARKYFNLAAKDSQSTDMTLVDFKKIAHEVSNPLTIINNYLYMLGKRIDSDHPAQEEIKFIGEEIERVGHILRQAKDPKAPAKAKYQLVNINKLLTELETLFRDSLYRTKQIESILLLDKQIPDIYCSKDKLKQIFINIIKNSVEAMAENKSIRITTRDNIYQNSQQFIEISIQDNGPGIAPEILKDLFKPVTSTKEGHSGLGLSIVNSLIQEISGNITCYSNHNQGTEFKILIPRKYEESEIKLT